MASEDAIDDEVECNQLNGESRKVHGAVLSVDEGGNRKKFCVEASVPSTTVDVRRRTLIQLAYSFRYTKLKVAIPSVPVVTVTGTVPADADGGHKAGGLFGVP